MVLLALAFVAACGNRKLLQLKSSDLVIKKQLLFMLKNVWKLFIGKLQRS